MMPELPPFKNTELPNPGMLELIALRIYCRTPRRHSKAKRASKPSVERYGRRQLKELLHVDKASPNQVTQPSRCDNAAWGTGGWRNADGNSPNPA